jgi:hypothetical protein
MSVNLLIGLDFKLFGTDLKAGYLKLDKGYKILLTQPETEKNEGISIAEFISSIEKLAGKQEGLSADTMKEKIQKSSENKAIDLDKIKIKLSSIYLKVVSDGTKTDCEYAFRFDIIADGLVPKAIKDIVDVKLLTIAVWNTTSDKILEQLAIPAELQNA